MRKSLFLSVIAASFLCTACINSFAVQELNKIGTAYLDKGDVDNAIARFKSGIDLDENVFETRYNLGVAYISKEDYENAVKTLEYAIKIKPNSKDAYYSYAVALENDGLSFEKEKTEQTDGVENIKQQEPAKEEVVSGLEKLEKAIETYSKYIALEDNADEANKVENHIKELKSDIQEYKTKYKLDDEASFSVETEE